MIFYILQKPALVKKGNKTSAAIKQLQNILDRFERKVKCIWFFILNTFFLWDLWQIIALNKWKKINKSLVSNWFNAL